MVLGGCRSFLLLVTTTKNYVHKLINIFGARYSFSTRILLYSSTATITAKGGQNFVPLSGHFRLISSQDSFSSLQCAQIFNKGLSFL